MGVVVVDDQVEFLVGRHTVTISWIHSGILSTTHTRIKGSTAPITAGDGATPWGVEPSGFPVVSITTILWRHRVFPQSGVTKVKNTLPITLTGGIKSRPDLNTAIVAQAGNHTVGQVNKGQVFGLQVSGAVSIETHVDGFTILVTDRVLQDIGADSVAKRVTVLEHGLG